MSRQPGQNTEDELRAGDMRSKLEEKERKHFLKTKSTNFEGGHCCRCSHACNLLASSCKASPPAFVLRLQHDPIDLPLPALPSAAEEREEDLRLLESAAAAAGDGGGGGGAPRTLVPKAVDADDEDDADDSDSSDDDDEVGAAAVWRAVLSTECTESYSTMRFFFVAAKIIDHEAELLVSQHWHPSLAPLLQPFHS